MLTYPDDPIAEDSIPDDPTSVDPTSEEDYIEPCCEPECPKASEDDEVECEFKSMAGSWWCTTHNCWA